MMNAAARWNVRAGMVRDRRFVRSEMRWKAMAVRPGM